jgi:hypothetical protein
LEDGAATGISVVAAPVLEGRVSLEDGTGRPEEPEDMHVDGAMGMRWVMVSSDVENEVAVGQASSPAAVLFSDAVGVIEGTDDRFPVTIEEMNVELNEAGAVPDGTDVVFPVSSNEMIVLFVDAVGVNDGTDELYTVTKELGTVELKVGVGITVDAPVPVVNGPVELAETGGTAEDGRENDPCRGKPLLLKLEELLDGDGKELDTVPIGRLELAVIEGAVDAPVPVVNIPVELAETGGTAEDG